MAKVYKVLLAVFIFGALIIYYLTANSSEALNLKVDGQAVQFSSSEEPFIQNSVTYVPLDVVTNTLGAQLNKNDDGSLATVIYNGIVLDINKDKVFKYEQGVASNLNAIPIVQDEEIFLPARNLLESFGYDVTWNKETKTISAKLNNSTKQDTYKFGEEQQTAYTYKGILNNGIPDVRGQMTFNNGTIYKGQIYQATVSGSGIENYQDGDIFNGTFNAGKRNGFAEYNDYNNATISGIWKSGSLQGEGTVLYFDGSKYEGNLSDGKRNGNGTFYFANGDIYTGAWSEDQFEGKGVYTFSNGSSYDGAWKDGKLNGVVIYTSTAGKYKCTFKNGEVSNVE